MLTKLLKRKDKDIIGVYIVAGFPEIDSLAKVVSALECRGIDFIEVGIPCTSPTLDGVVIRRAHKKAIENGMNIKILFSQLREIRIRSSLPIVLMGYHQSIDDFGMQPFCERFNKLGIDGLLIPDIVFGKSINCNHFIFLKYGIPLVRIITPTTDKRSIKRISEMSKPFIYIASGETTGAKDNYNEGTIEFFDYVKKTIGNIPSLIGFGISNQNTFNVANTFSYGGIIGSLFIKIIENSQSYEEAVDTLLNKIVNARCSLN